MLRPRHPGATLDAYVDGELDTAQQRDVAAHLDGCRGCTEAATTTVEIRRSLRRLASTAPLEIAIARLHRWATALRR
jgi:anti-sigma factor RsiW